MDPVWGEYHARGVITDSRTLSPSAFPSLPLDRQDVYSDPRRSSTASGSINTETSDGTESGDYGTDEEIVHAYDTDEHDAEDDDSDFYEIDPYDVENDDTCAESSTCAEESDPDVNIPSSVEPAKYRFIQYHSKDRNIEDKVRVERKRLHGTRVPSKVLFCSEKTVKRRPKCVNMDQLREKYKELQHKKEILVSKLCKLGYSDSGLETFILTKAVKPVPERPISIKAYLRVVQNLEWLVGRLEFILGNAQVVAKARRKFFIIPRSEVRKARTELSKPRSPELLPRDRVSEKRSRSGTLPAPINRVRVNRKLKSGSESLNDWLHPPPLKGTFTDTGGDIDLSSKSEAAHKQIRTLGSMARNGRASLHY